MSRQTHDREGDKNPKAARGAQADTDAQAENCFHIFKLVYLLHVRSLICYT